MSVAHVVCSENGTTNGIPKRHQWLMIQQFLENLHCFYFTVPYDRRGGTKIESITRRVFLKRTVSGVGGIMLAKSLGPNISLAQPSADMSRVVVVEHPDATDGVKVINAANVQAMMEESVKQLTGEATVADAWASLLPDFREEHLIAIKVNTTSRLLPTHPDVVDVIVAGLTAAGVRENNIIVYDIGTNWLLDSGYKPNKGDIGVRCFGTFEKITGGVVLNPNTAVDEEGWGDDWDNPVDILGRKMALSTILTRCDHLINVPVLKAHGWNVANISLSLKNQYGSVNNPQMLHNNFATACATLNSQEAIKGKTRLIAIDALFGCWSGHFDPPQFAPNSLIMTRDPVAADYIGAEMINEERARLNLPPKSIQLLLRRAAEMGLGTNDPNKIELLKVVLGAPEKQGAKEEVEEEKPDEERVVDPTGSYRTQWGNIKRSG